MLKRINTFLRYVFFAVIVKFVVLIIIGINVRNRERLPQNGPAIIVANHNSHLDTLVLINLFQLKYLPLIHPVAAADYFLKNKLIAWFAREIIGIIPISRQGIKMGIDPLIPCYQALEQDQILILFPEGTRGEPEQLSAFKKGVAYLAEKYPKVPIIPIYMHGLGKALPKGEYLLVPFFCDIFVGEPLYWQTDKPTFMKVLNERFDQLVGEGHFSAWL
jgi:1-acyl-sn-glycerol-3-phosphate acyltransferase